MYCIVIDIGWLQQVKLLRRRRGVATRQPGGRALDWQSERAALECSVGVAASHMFEALTSAKSKKSVVDQADGRSQVLSAALPGAPLGLSSPGPRGPRGSPQVPSGHAGGPPGVPQGVPSVVPARCASGGRTRGHLWGRFEILAWGPDGAGVIAARGGEVGQVALAACSMSPPVTALVSDTW